MNQPTDQPETLQEWLWYVRQHQANIYVRHQAENGKWGNIALSELSPELWAKHVAGWLERGTVPCRVLEQKEQNSKPE